MITKDEWLKLPEPEQIKVLEKCLRELLDIDQGKHKLSYTKEQGKLIDIKQEQEHFIFELFE